MFDTHGPLFTGEAERLAGRACDDMEQEIARTGVDMVRARLSEVIRHPTGYYESHISEEHSGAGSAVTDSGVVYGPWLEGVGSRNRTTRFKGYATFRRVAQALDARAQAIAERVAEPFIRRMG